MEITVAFWFIVAALVFAFFHGPVSHLCTGVVKFKKINYPNGKRYTRSSEPEKFYLHVAVEIVSLIFIFGVVYWVMFVLKPRTN